MNTRYTYILLALLMSFYFVPASAQQKKPAAKKPATTTAKKPAAKPTKKPAKPVTATQQKTSAKNLGDAAATADTTKKGGQTNGNTPNGAGLTEEIVVTTAYKPVLAEAVKIRRNPGLEDAPAFKAPLDYSPIDKKLSQDNNIRALDAMKRPAEQDSVLLNNYVKAGAGSLKTTYAEGYFSNGRDQALQVGGFLKHFAQAGNINKQNEIKDELGVFGKSINQDYTLSGRIG
jgi:hypothetical protein